MAHNRIRPFAQLRDGHELPAQAAVPAGFVVIPIEQLPPAMRQSAGCCGELYQIAFEQARASAEAADVDGFAG